MRSSVKIHLGLLAVLLLLVATPAVAQESIVGYFEGPLHGHNGVSGAESLTGWAVATSGVRQVVIQVDGVDIGQAQFGVRRPDVEQAHPGFADSSAAGFTYRLNTTEFPNGLHAVSAKVETWAGNHHVIPGTRAFFFNNNTFILAPFGRINRPMPATQLYGVCDPLAPFRRPAVVEGWALDLGVESGDAGVAWVELLLDGAVLLDTRTDCRFIPALGGFTACYGLPRPDIENQFPFAFDAPASGFRFAFDVGALLIEGGGPYVQGQHVLTIRAGDVIGQLANIDEIPVTFFCVENLGNEGAFGRIEVPGPGRFWDGIVTFRGWALDFEGIDPSGRVEIFIDGIDRGNAEYGVGRRLYVEQRYPGYPDSMSPVWRFVFDTNELSDGVHDLQVFVVDNDQVRSLIGETTFVVDNEIPD